MGVEDQGRQGGPGDLSTVAPSRLLQRRATLRERVHTILDEGDMESRTGVAVEILLMGLILSNVAAIILETVPSIYKAYAGFFTGFEAFTVYVFATEYVVRLWSSVEDPRLGAAHPVTSRLRCAIRPMMIVDLISFAPFLLLGAIGASALALRSLRILRLLRLLKIARYSPAVPALVGVVYTERRALIGTFILLMCAMSVTGEVMHQVEGPVQPAVFGTLPDCIYWAITTLATVGYGDKVPITMAGRLVAGCTMIIGLVLFAMPIGIISTGIVNSLHRREFNVTWSMIKRQPLFDGIDVDTLKSVLGLVGAALIQDHARVMLAGQQADRFYVVVSGHATAENETGSWVLGPGDVVGAEAYFDVRTYRTTVTAQTEMRLMVFGGDELRRLCRKSPLLKERIEAALA